MLKKSDNAENITMPFKGSVESIRGYDEFLTSWQAFISDKGKKALKHQDQNNIEEYAANSLSRLVSDNDDFNEYAPSDLFDTLHNSAAICNAKGQVIAANKQASNDHDLMKDSMIDSLEILSENNLPLSHSINLALSKNTKAKLTLKQCHFHDSDTLFPVAIVKLDKKKTSDPAVLVILMDSACDAETIELLAAKFGLTRAESDILKAFTKGITLKEIAESRCRSYTTIRNQFQSVLEKTGCSNQTDLLRMLLGMSYLLSFTEVIKPTEAPTGKQIQLMRPHGRFVDVSLYGKLDGTPFIMLPSIFGIPVTEAIEAELYSRSLLLIGVWRPGFSETTERHESEDYYDCLAGDISAVLNNMGVEQCPILGRASAARSVFNLARIMPERISRAAMVNSLVPLPFVSKNKVLSKWTTSLISAMEHSPTMAKLILGAGRRLLLGAGVDSFINKMYGASPSDLAISTQEDVQSSLYQGVLMASKQGLNAPTRDMIFGFRDWSEDVDQAAIKVTLLQGSNDPNVSIKASRDFAKHFPDKVELIEFEDGGGLMSYSHSNAIWDWVEGLASNPEVLPAKSRVRQ